MAETQWEFNYDSVLTVREQFELYDRQNPDVYTLFKRFASDLRSAGRERYSARIIIERIRWHYAVNQDREDGEFKINNNFIPWYARKLLAEDPTYTGFFELRQMKTP